MVDAATEFKKSGFSDEDSATLAGVSAMFQNVADDAISAGDSAGFIIAQLKAFNLEASDATHVIDAVNNVSNNFAVSSSDLSTNLGKASAALASGNTSFEETLGLMTAITEITRNGSRSARGLVSIQSRLNQVVDESSSTGKQLIELYKGQNIALFDQNGQLRDSYDILKDLAAVWPTLTRNQQAEFALTQAGANQTQNFTALMNNFQVAIDATATAMDSTGSAMKENTSYMESLEAQTTQLKATFQDFANNVIDKELVSSILTLANDILGALNTETGKTITQWGLLTGVLTGGIVIYGQIAGKLLSAGSAVVTLGKALSAGTATATMFTSAALPIAAAIGAIAIAGWEVYKWYKETHKPLQEYTDEIQANTQQLEQNRDRLAEIEQMSWDKKTPEILDEYDALIKENEELQRNIDLLEHRRTEQAKRQARKGGEVATGGTYYTAVGYDDFTQYKDAETAYLSLASANQLVVESAEDAKQQLEAIGITLQENAEMVTVDADAYNEDLTASMQEYADQLNSTHSLNQDQLKDFNQLKATVSERVEGLKQLEAEGYTLTESERNLIAVYDSLIKTESEAKEWTDKYGDALIITDEQAKQLIKTFPALKNQLIDTGSGWTILNNNAQTAANGLISADGRIKKSSRDRTKVVLEDLNATITYYGLIAKAFNTMGTASGYTATQAKQANELARSFDATRKQLQAAITRGIYDDTGSADTPPGTTTTTKKDKDKDLALEEFKNLQKDLEHQKELGLIKEEEYYNKLGQLIKDYKAKATAHMKEYGTDVDTINRNMYQYEEEIYKGRAKLAEDLAEKQKKAAEEAAKAQKEALEKQKEDFESAVDYVVKNIDKEITKLQDLRDQTEKYYDEQIDALNESNDALENQIKYEELLDNLARAKQKKLYVFQDGKFQYVQDTEAISSAKAELDTYEREKVLRQEVKNLETLKDQALASIDKQIDGWEKYKEEWESVTTQYQDQQGKLLVEQVLGIDIEQKNWETRLANAQSFVNRYNSILSQLNSGAVKISSGSTSGSTGSGSSDDKYIYRGQNVFQSAYDSYVAKGDYERANRVVKQAKSRGQIVNQHANGTISAPGGLSLVGEKGPELRVLNSGDGIIPADATRNLWDWAKFSPKEFNGGTMIHIANLNLPNVRDGNDFVKYMVNNFWRETVQYAST